MMNFIEGLAVTAGVLIAIVVGLAIASLPVAFAVSVWRLVL